MEQSILTQDHGTWCEITLNRPDRLNAFTDEMHLALRAALEEARDSGKRALLLTGAGRGFCAGQDLSARNPDAAGGPVDLGYTVRTFYAPLVNQIRALEFPVVCAVNGVAAGAGANLSLAGSAEREIYPVLCQGRADPRHRWQLSPAAPAGRGPRQSAGADRRAAECRTGCRLGADLEMRRR